MRKKCNEKRREKRKGKEEIERNHEWCFTMRLAGVKEKCPGSRYLYFNYHPSELAFCKKNSLSKDIIGLIGKCTLSHMFKNFTCE